MNPEIGKALNTALFRLQQEGRDEPCESNRHFYEIEEGTKFLKVIRTNGTRAAPHGVPLGFLFRGQGDGGRIQARWLAEAREDCPLQPARPRQPSPNDRHR